MVYLKIPLKWSLITLKSWNSTNWFSNSTGSSVTSGRFSLLWHFVLSELHVYIIWICVRVKFDITNIRYVHFYEQFVHEGLWRYNLSVHKTSKYPHLGPNVQKTWFSNPFALETWESHQMHSFINGVEDSCQRCECGGTLVHTLQEVWGSMAYIYPLP